MIQFTLYSRTYCHLCDDMLTALQGLMISDEFAITVLDVDADEALVAQYDELVPVLLASKDGAAAQRLCHYFLDEAAVRAFIAGS
ncbi:MAG: glutaredoxin family protein [Pseudomonadota bacterium]